MNTEVNVSWEFNKLNVENLKIAKEIKIKEDNRKLQEEVKLEKEKKMIWNRVRRTWWSMFNSFKTIVSEFKKSSIWFWFNNKFSVEKWVIWQSINPSRSERRKHYKYKVNNKSIQTSHPNMREWLEKQAKEKLLRSLRLNTCKELRWSF